jgi:tyrosine-protein kinase Etk/Wzc
LEQHPTEYLVPLYKKKGKIFSVALLVGIIFYAFSYLLPKYYEAKISVLPTSSSSSDFNLNSFGQVLPILGISPNDNNADLYIQILRSRTVAERVLEQFNLKKVWELESNEKAIKRLAGQTSMVATREGMILLSFESKNPELSANIANAYIEELDRVNQEKNMSKARSARLYIEEQLAITEQELAEASRKLADFQLKNKTINLTEQLTAAIEQAGELKGQIIARQVQLGILKQSIKTGNRLQELNTEINQLQLQYNKLQFGGDLPLAERKEFFIAFSEAPEVAMQFADLMRQVKVKETVFQLLNQQYYQAKIEEAKDTPTIQVLDKAKIPEKKSRPFRTLIALTGFIIGGLVSTFRVVSKQYSKALKEQHPEEYQKWSEFKNVLKKDRFRLLGKKTE